VLCYDRHTPPETVSSQAVSHSTETRNASRDLLWKIVGWGDRNRRRRLDGYVVDAVSQYEVRKRISKGFDFPRVASGREWMRLTQELIA